MQVGRHRNVCHMNVFIEVGAFWIAIRGGKWGGLASVQRAVSRNRTVLVVIASGGKEFSLNKYVDQANLE